MTGPHVGDSHAPHRRRRASSTGQLGRGGRSLPEPLDLKVSAASSLGNETLAGQQTPMSSSLTPLSSHVRQTSLGSGLVRNRRDEYRHASTPARNSSKALAKQRAGAILEEQHAQRVGQPRRVRTSTPPTPDRAGVARASASGRRAVDAKEDERSDEWLLPSFITSEHLKRAE